MRDRMSGGTQSNRWWLDVRFVIGLVLVVASVAGVLWIVSSVDTSTRVYAARASLSPGDRLGAADLVDVSVRLPEHAARYLTSRDVPASGLIVTRAVGAGELVPLSAVGASAGLRTTSLVVPVEGQLARDLGPGSIVDVWAAAATGTGTFAAPIVLVSSATVVRVITPDGLVGTARGSSVEILVPRSKTARVLEAVANAAAIALVPASLPAGR